MTAAEALSRAIATLRAAGTPDPARDARRLLAHAARIDTGGVGAGPALALVADPA